MQRVAPLFPFEVEMELPELYAHLVDPFGSRHRELAWSGFRMFCDTLMEAGVRADVFIGGPFLTNATDAEDIQCAVAVLGPPGEFSEGQADALRKLAHDRDPWAVRHHCEFDLFFDDGDLVEMIDRWLNATCSNASGPPIRAVKVKLCP